MIFEHPADFISVRNCERICLRGISLDWDWGKHPVASMGVICAVDEHGCFFDMEFPMVQDIPETMDIRIFSPFDPVRYLPGCPDGIEFRPYRNHAADSMGTGETEEQMEKLVRELSNRIERMEKIAPNRMRFHSVHPEWTRRRLKRGQCYNLRHYEYDMVAVSLFDSRNVTLQGVTVYSCPGSGFVGNGDISRIHFDGCRVTPRPGTSRSITAAADCLHIANSTGRFLIENCDFSYAGDDCINIHDNTCMGIQQLDSHTIRALRVRRNAVLFEAGYSVELRNPDLSPVGYSSPLTEVRYDETDNTCLLRFADSLPSGLSPDTILFNERFHTENFIIRRNRFTNNRARGVLIHGSNGIVEENLFENIQGAAVQIETGCEKRWSEGKGVRNLVFRRNRIQSCDRNAWQMAVFYMGTYLPSGRTKYPVFQNILIEENTIVDCPRLAMFLSSCRDVLVQNNCIINSNQIPTERKCYGSSQEEAPVYGETYNGIIQVSHAEDVCVQNNFFTETFCR